MSVNAADTAWILISTALVMLMTPGLALFYGGMVRRKNAISTTMMSFCALGVVGLLWVLYGYSFCFGADRAGLIGGVEHLFLRGVEQAPSAIYASTVPHLAFFAFQGMFAIITVALISGAVVERMRFGALVLFSALWVTIVYCPVAHWVWGAGGWLLRLGALDFAGGTVVHICAGFSALALAIVLGPRKGYHKGQVMEPHNIPMVVLGAGLLWFGWFGFNGGSALAANGLAASAFFVTNISAAAGGLAWLAASWVRGKPSSLGMVSGAIAGLVAITPAAGYVTVTGAIAIGLIAGLVCYGCMLWRIRKNLDESLDAWSIHGMGGLWGAIATGIFAVAAVNGYSGLIEGNVTQFIANAIGAFAAMIYAFVVTYILAWVVDKAIGLRVSEEEEYVGLDISQHGERV